MDPYKSLKLNTAIQRVLSELLQQAVKDPRVGLVSVADVALNRDRSVARVYWSALGGDDERRRSEQGLRQARGFLQRRVGEILKLRQAPELRFVYDDALDRGFGIDRVLRDLDARGELADQTARRRRLRLGDLQPPVDLLRALRGGRRVWTVPHWNPDPDAMGGALALAAGLSAAGAEAVALCHPDPPPGFEALPGFADSLPAAEAAAEIERQPPDLVVMIDCHRRDRAGELAPLLERVPAAWTIDHHLVTARRAPLPGWIEAAACSSCTLVYRVLEELAQGGDGTPRFAIDRDMATNLYAGLVNDTGGFRFSNTGPLSFELAQRLAALGVDVADTAERTLHRRSRAALDLARRVLETFAYSAEGRILTLRADRGMMAAAGAVLSDTEGLVNLATAVAGVRFVIFLKELAPQEWRVSLRAAGRGDVQEVAARFGGGGHAQAAGCTLRGEAEEVAARLAAALAEQL